MYLTFENQDTIKILDMRQMVTFNNGAVEERCSFILPLENYTRETVDVLKKYFKKGDDYIYSLALKDEESDEEFFKEFKSSGLISIEWVAPENTKNGAPQFIIATQELLF